MLPVEDNFIRKIDPLLNPLAEKSPSFEKASPKTSNPPSRVAIISLEISFSLPPNIFAHSTSRLSVYFMTNTPVFRLLEAAKPVVEEVYPVTA